MAHHLLEYTVTLNFIKIFLGSSDYAFDLKTKFHGGFFSMFDPVVKCGDDPEVKHGKPHPDAYLIACSRFKNPPSPEKVSYVVDQ